MTESKQTNLFQESLWDSATVEGDVACCTGAFTKLLINVLTTSRKRLLIETTEMLCVGHLPEGALLSFLVT